MLDIVKPPILAVGEFYILTGQAIRNVFRRPHYGKDIIMQMDNIGVGSLPIVILALVGLFVSRYLAAFQLGHTESVWDPFFGDGTRTTSLVMQTHPYHQVRFIDSIHVRTSDDVRIRF